ncbi:MAG TPA: MucR family transcriptional regulator [Rhodopila sp.]|nr:MucR family transcriptional regulator [Rhodopila sp.]
MQNSSDRLLTLTAQIVRAYLEAHAVPTSMVPGFIRDVGHSLSTVVSSLTTTAVHQPAPEERAVNLHRSVFPEYIVCLEDGLKVKTLKRHLKTAHGMTPDEYRTRWKLPADYPMIAPEYAGFRSRLARQSGLGKKR